MSELAPFTPQKAHEIAEAVLIRGDLAQLTHAERAKYFVRVCESVGLNPLTKPFEYIELNGRLTLYARKDATDQLRKLHGVSVTEITETEREGVFCVTAYVRDRDGRTDVAKGAVNIANLKGDVLANALMKAETKAKRRATLSICGLGLLDETEVEDIPAAAKAEPKEPPAKAVVRTIMPTPKHSLKADGLANRAIAARNANKWDGDGLPGGPWPTQGAAQGPRITPRHDEGEHGTVGPYRPWGHSGIL